MPEPRSAPPAGEAPAPEGPAAEARKAWMGLLARAPAPRLKALWADHVAESAPPAHAWLRRPESGAVMLRGRAGAVGAPFNLGEMTVTRCALRLEGTEAVGHAWVQGRDREKARLAALCDALMTTDRAEAIETAILVPLRRDEAGRAAARAAKAAKTKVDFFTMVRGEPE